jgi:hypothetical protein
LPAEQVAAIFERAIGRVEAVLQVEHGAQTTAKILIPAQAPARGTQAARVLQELAAVLPASGTFCVVHVHHARVDETVKRHAALRMSDTCEKHRRCNDQILQFH